MKLIFNNKNYRHKIITKIYKKHKSLVNKLGYINKNPVDSLNIIIKYYEILISIKMGVIMSKGLNKFFYKIIKTVRRDGRVGLLHLI